MTRTNYNRRQFSRDSSAVYDNPKKLGRPLPQKPQRPINLVEFERQAATHAKETGEPLADVRRRWLLDELAARQPMKRGPKNNRKSKAVSAASSGISRHQCASADGSIDIVCAEQVPDRHSQLAAPRAAAKRPSAKQLSAPSNREKVTTAPMWRPVDVNRFYGDGTPLGSSQAHVLVADPDTVILRVRGVGKFIYRLDRPSTGNKVYHLDTDERDREETLQFMRGRKRLFGTWRSRTNAGGWSIAFRDV
jgi:hypothetical protein